MSNNHIIDNNNNDIDNGGSVNNKKQKLKHNNEIDTENRNLNSPIKEGIDPLELLFWKVFRNIFIFRTIMSNMDTESTLPYDSLINVQTLIDWNQLDILRDKVIRNQYLTFNINNGSEICNLSKFSRTEDTFKSIFESIKQDNEQDRLFYKHLFKNYSQYSTLLSNIGLVRLNEIQVDKLVKQLIKIKCIPAIQVLIQEYQYKPSLDNFKNVLLIDNLKLLKLFLQPQFNLHKQLSNTNNNVFNIKILNHCYNEKLINNQELKLRIHRIPNIIKFEVLSLKSLITIVKLILKCTNDDKDNFQVEVESFSNNLSKSELKSLLSDKSNQIESKKEMIEKLLQLFYSFSNISNQFYHIYFSKNGDEDINITDIKQAYISTFRFANYKLLQIVMKNKKSNQLSLDLLEPEFLFSHSQDKEKQMEFIKLVIGLYKDYDDLESLFKLILYNDDLDQIKFVIKELHYENEEEDSDLNTILYYTRSTMVLDWLFENHFNLLNATAIWYFRNVELLQHYETLYKQKCTLENNENNLIDITTQEYIHRDYINIEVLKYIFTQGSTKFNYTYNSINGIYDQNGNKSDIYCIVNRLNYSSNGKFKMFKLIYQNFKNGIDQFSSFVKPILSRHIYSYSIHFNRIIIWVYKNFKNDYLNYFENEIQFNKVLRYHGIIANNPNIQNSNQDNQDEEDDQDDPDFFLVDDEYKNPLKFNLNYFSANENKIQYLELILSTHCAEYHSNVSKIISYSCIYGKLKTIEYIHQNYPNVIFNTIELQEFLLTSLQYNQLKVSEYLFQLVSITKQEFERKSGELSKLYFINKSF